MTNATTQAQDNTQAPILEGELISKADGLEVVDLGDAGAAAPADVSREDKVEQEFQDLNNFDVELKHGNIKNAMKGVKSRDLWSVDPRKLRFLEAFNVRIRTPEHDAHVQGIKKSIIANGFHPDQPITVLVQKDPETGEDVLYVTGGHCRTEAVMLAIAEGHPIKTIPAVTEDRNTTIEELTVKLHQSNTGKPFTPFEVGLTCKRLDNFGWTTAEIATKMNLIESYVVSLIGLVSSARVIRQAVIMGAMSASQAIKLIKTHGDNAAAALERMKARAEKEGSTRITDKHVDGAKFKKAMKNHGPALFDAVKIISKDPAFANLSADARAALSKVMTELNTAKAADNDTEEDFIEGEATRVELVEGEAAKAPDDASPDKGLEVEGAESTAQA